MLSDVEEGDNLMLTRLTQVATLKATLWTVVEFGASQVLAGNTSYYVSDKRYEPAIIL